MARKTETVADPEIAPEYDFSRGERGKYHKRYQSAALKDAIVLEPALRRVFPESTAVNEALRTLLRIAAAGDQPAVSARTRRRKAG